MAEPRKVGQPAEDDVRQQLDQHLDERLADILRPELEAAEAELTHGTTTPSGAAGAAPGSASAAPGGASTGARSSGEPAFDSPASGQPGDGEAAADPDRGDKDFIHALGGWGALLDIGLPWIAFLVVYAASDHDLGLALIVAVATGAAVALLRLIRKQPLRNVLGGFVGVLISAWVANRSGRAEDVYLPGLLMNAGYGALYLITVLIRWPLFGVIYGLVTQTGAAWRRDAVLVRAFSRATLVFVGLFAVRLVVQVPLYLTGSLNALGIAKVGLGLPFYALALYLAYAVLRGSLPPDKWAEARDHVTHLLRPKKK